MPKHNRHPPDHKAKHFGVNGLDPVPEKGRCCENARQRESHAQGLHPAKTALPGCGKMNICIQYAAVQKNKMKNVHKQRFDSHQNDPSDRHRIAESPKLALDEPCTAQKDKERAKFHQHDHGVAVPKLHPWTGPVGSCKQQGPSDRHGNARKNEPPHECMFTPRLSEFHEFEGGKCPCK